MLKILVFVCGAALMALEILGARILAPYLGSSIFVWGALITSFMMAMSAGYWAGGRLSERAGHSRMLGLVIAAAGALTLLVPTLAHAVLPWASALGPRTGPLAAAIAIFFVPTLLLACVSPIAVRIAASASEGVGRTAGRLYSISTAGSILGSLGTAFWLIPSFPTDALVLGIGGLLLLTGIVAAFAPSAAEEPRAAPVWTGALAAVAALGVAFAAVAAVAPQVTPGVPLGDRLVFKQDTQYHRITVYDHGTIRSLRFDNRRQSAIDMRDGYTSDIAYTDYLSLAFALKPDAKRILVLGLGGGAFPERVLHDHPGARVDAVEIDPVVVDVAHRYFGLPETDAVRVTVGDARRYVATTHERYDMVVVDAYYADALPFHLATTEFFHEVRGVLTTDGVVSYNIIGAVEGNSSKLFRSMHRTISGVWPDVYVFPIAVVADKNPQAMRNIVVLASSGAVPYSVLLERIASGVDGRVKVPKFSSFGADLYTKRVSWSGVPVLSDQYAPTDALIHLD